MTTKYILARRVVELLADHAPAEAHFAALVEACGGDVTRALHLVTALACSLSHGMEYVYNWDDQDQPVAFSRRTRP
jgi:hypothetical protein